MTRLADFVAVIRVLRTGPVSVAEIAKATKIRARTVYRLLKDLEDAGARLQKRDAEFERVGRGGSAATLFTLTTAALDEWLGRRGR
jgi:predicted DNA-binding transcriptional regulator YafY